MEKVLIHDGWPLGVKVFVNFQGSHFLQFFVSFVWLVKLNTLQCGKWRIERLGGCDHSRSCSRHSNRAWLRNLQIVCVGEKVGLLLPLD